MNISAENIFSLSTPDGYDCFVERYHANFQVIRLWAECFLPNPPPAEHSLEFVFTGVLYFEGALNWTGANVCIASRRECYELLVSAKLIDASAPDEIEETLDTYHLFVIPTTSSARIKFVAHRTDYAVNIMG